MQDFDDIDNLFRCGIAPLQSQGTQQICQCYDLIWLHHLAKSLSNAFNQRLFVIKFQVPLTVLEYNLA